MNTPHHREWTQRIMDFSVIATAGLSLMACVIWILEWQRDSADQANLSQLNRMVAEYQSRTGRIPDINMIELFRHGLSPHRLHATPYGGTYQIDPHHVTVYNPHRPFKQTPRSGP
jgi:hypothetical protein